MLFVIMGKAKAGTARERLARRVQWQYPEEIRVTAEYWLPTNDPKLITNAEADVPVLNETGARVYDPQAEALHPLPDTFDSPQGATARRAIVASRAVATMVNCG